MDAQKEIEQLATDFEQCRKVLIALGDENRQHMILEMMKMKDCYGVRVNDISKKTHLSRPAVSHHLQILKQAGILNMRKEGTKNYYYAEAAESCWGGLRLLVEHVDAVIRSAKENGYPRFKEES